MNTSNYTTVCKDIAIKTTKWNSTVQCNSATVVSNNKETGGEIGL